MHGCHCKYAPRAEKEKTGRPPGGSASPLDAIRIIAPRRVRAWGRGHANYGFGRPSYYAKNYLLAGKLSSNRYARTKTDIWSADTQGTKAIEEKGTCLGSGHWTNSTDL